MSKLRVATFQRRPRFRDIPRILERLRADLEWCDDEGVDLALFPECYLQGYVLDRPTLNGVALAIEHDVTFRGLLARLAPIRSTFVLGFVERRERFVFNTGAAIRHGAVLGAYRKAHLHRKEQAFDPGFDCPIFEAAGWKFGINICYDANFPSAAAKIASQGARLICYPINNMLPTEVADRWRSKSICNLRRRAAETGCWVVSSDVVGEHEAMVCHGCTCVVSPAGDVVARVDEGHEGVVLFDCG
ncbi:MAG TPA: carbon-nitrogen hydrolase family protein [Dongiaceae bacterium]|nr:carbon-nitrogen hydrolase family protein [Dongiaceae bacterium]